MRGSVAKALRRRQAQAATEGAPERTYLRFDRTNVIVVDPKTTRGAYKRLKKERKKKS